VHDAVAQAPAKSRHHELRHSLNEASVRMVNDCIADDRITKGFSGIAVEEIGAQPLLVRTRLYFCESWVGADARAKDYA